MALFIGAFVFVFSLFGKLLLLPFRFSSCRLLLHASRFCLDPDCPDETHQFASDRSYDLSLLFACSHQLHVTLVQAILSFPSDLRVLRGIPFLALAQLGPDAWPMSIAPG
jgi:hypothetical protein